MKYDDLVTITEGKKKKKTKDKLYWNPLWTTDEEKIDQLKFYTEQSWAHWILYKELRYYHKH